LKYIKLSSGLLGAALFSALSLSSAIGFAQGPDFDKRKAEHLSEIDRRIQKMQEHRSCISNATNIEALRKCQDAMRDSMKAERDEHRERREERLKSKGN